jgi:hypothetical protein
VLGFGFYGLKQAELLGGWGELLPGQWRDCDACILEFFLKVFGGCGGMVFDGAMDKEVDAFTG